MKKISIVCASALMILASCTDDQTGIPPIDAIEENHSITAPLQVVNASDIDNDFYQKNKNQKVTIKGNILVKGTLAYFELKDKTLIQIFAQKSTFQTLSQQSKDKLKINGQELSVTGTLTDYKNKQGTIIKEIIYQKEADLVFGNTPAQPPVANIVEATASDIDEAFYQQHKNAKTTIKLKGNIVVKTIKKNKYSYILLGDNTEVQVFSYNLKKFKPEIIQKLQTQGQEVTITGVFEDHTLKSGKVIKEIKFDDETNLIFGRQTNSTTPSTQQIEDIDASTATINAYVVDKKVKLTGSISADTKNKRTYVELSDGTRIQLYSKNFKSFQKETKDKLLIQGQKVVVTGVFKDHKIKSGVVKQLHYESESDISFE